jgi:hypothetical protein
MRRIAIDAARDAIQRAAVSTSRTREHELLIDDEGPLVAVQRRWPV